MNKLDRSKKGFTLIEVVLVLAVGSLIFAMAFLAYGQASVNRRDTQRRADLGKIASELENYASDNNGKYPEKNAIDQNASTYGTFARDYISGLKDPSSGMIYVQDLGNVPLSDPNRQLDIEPGSTEYSPEEQVFYTQTFCDGTRLPPGNRDYVIRMKLEKGVACRDSKQ